MSARGVLRALPGDRIALWCPACKCAHSVPIKGPEGWDFNGNYDRPTLTPSLRVTWSHPKGFSNENPAPVGFPSQKDSPGMWTNECCHSFVTDGKIIFLPDCTHALAGKTVPLEAF